MEAVNVLKKILQEDYPFLKSVKVHMNSPLFVEVSGVKIYGLSIVNCFIELNSKGRVPNVSNFMMAAKIKESQMPVLGLYVLLDLWSWNYPLTRRLEFFQEIYQRYPYIVKDRDEEMLNELFKKLALDLY